MTDFGVDACRNATNNQRFQDGTTEVFESMTLPGRFDATTGTYAETANRGEYQVRYTIAPGAGG